MSQDPRLSLLVEAAVEAGQVAARIYHGGFEVTVKADATPVTDADHAAEAVILRHLAQHLPHIPVVAEEQAAAGVIPVTGTEFFLVDPLDGTKEFINRSGDFTVNIALVSAGRPVLGVVYAPATGRLFAGDVIAGHAWRAQREPGTQGSAPEAIRVRPVPAAGVTAVASRSHRTPETDAYLAGYTVAELTSVGSSLKFCLVAEGAADLYPRLGPTMEWDTAAGHAVLAAAGGSVVAPDGAALAYGKPGFRNSWFVAAGPFEPLPLAAAKESA